jgi:hypothetical protein
VSFLHKRSNYIHGRFNMMESPLLSQLQFDCLCRREVSKMDSHQYFKYVSKNFVSNI